MSHSRKDGVRRGAHRDTWNREVWSKRCKLVNMWSTDAPRSGRGFKWYTHRYERRMAHREIIAQLAEAA